LFGGDHTGLFDELAFFSQSLSAAEVVELFTLPSGLTALRK
jgi:hypothetical protein